MKPKIREAALKALDKVIAQILSSVQDQLVLRVLESADGFIDATEDKIGDMETRLNRAQVLQKAGEAEGCKNE